MMLREIKNVKQVEGGPHRRWFAEEMFDLTIWSEAEKSPVIVGFQLIYMDGVGKKAFTWFKGKGFLHNLVDDGESRVYRPKMSPILTENCVMYKIEIVKLIMDSIHSFDLKLSNFIFDKIKDFKDISSVSEKYNAELYIRGTNTFLSIGNMFPIELKTLSSIIEYVNNNALFFRDNDAEVFGALYLLFCIKERWFAPPGYVLDETMKYFESHPPTINNKFKDHFLSGVEKLRQRIHQIRDENGEIIFKTACNYFNKRLEEPTEN